MPIDPSIPLQLRPIQLDNPLNNLAKVMQIRQLQQQGEMGDIQTQQARQALERQNQLRQLLGGFTPEMKPEEQAAQLTRGGYLPEAQTVTKTAAEASKLQREGESSKLENALKKFKLGTQILSSVIDEPSYQQARQIAAQQGFDPLPPNYDPAWVQQNLNIGIDYTKRLEEAARQRSEALTRRGQDVTMRGQDIAARTAAEKLSFDRGVATDDAGGPTQAALVKKFGKPSPHHRWKPDGSLEQIPGGPADEKATMKAKKEELMSNASVDRAKLMMGTIDDALAKTGFFTTGLTGAAIGKVPGTPAYDLRSTIDTVKANIGFSELNAMRQASPTGGALGQVAIKELDMLQATLGNLDANQSEPLVRKQLAAVKKHYENWKDVMKKAGYAGTEGAETNIGLTGKDKEAMDWAKANPNDPRSAKIKERLGAK